MTISKTLFKALREGKIDMAAGVQKSNVYSDIKYSTNYMEYMNVLVKSDTKSTKNALQGTMAQVRGRIIPITRQMQKKFTGPKI